MARDWGSFWQWTNISGLLFLFLCLPGHKDSALCSSQITMSVLHEIMFVVLDTSFFNSTHWTPSVQHFPSSCSQLVKQYQAKPRSYAHTYPLCFQYGWRRWFALCGKFLGGEVEERGNTWEVRGNWSKGGHSSSWWTQKQEQKRSERGDKNSKDKWG